MAMAGTRRATHAQPSRARQWLLLGALGLVGVAMTGRGVFASWVATTSATTGTQQATTVAVTQTDTNGTVFTSGVSSLLPGDYLYRYSNLVNSSDQSQAFTATFVGSGVLAGAGGLQVAVDSCSVAWASDGSCSGSLSPIATVRDVATAGTLSLGTVAGAATAHLRYKLLLNAAASQATFQGTSGTVTVTINGSTVATGGRDRTAG